MSKEIHLIIHKDEKSPKGIRFEISDYWVSIIRKELKESGESMLKAIISFVLPESKKTRKFLMGGLIPLQIYLDGNDHRDSDTVDFYFECFGKEYFPEVITRNGKVEVKRQSSKGRKMLQKYTDKFLEYLNEQYGVPYDSKAINVEEYKHFRDEIYPFTPEYDGWLDYCKKMGWLEFSR